MKLCNFCTVQAIREKAKRDGARVYIKGTLAIGRFTGGKDVFVVPEGQELDMSIDGAGNHGPQFKGWFAELPEKCVC